jgi:poly-gamma-glutamate synthesis protein (capsule biosynthesis protein)
MTAVIPLCGVRIGFLGDVMLGRLVGETIERTSYAYPWGNMIDELSKNDFNLANLETTFTESTRPVPKVFNYKSHPNNVQSLIEGSVDVVNIANNHILDYGLEGLIDTLRVLDCAGIKHVGAGMNAEEAAWPVIIEKKGIKIGIIGYTDNEPTWKAGINKPGTNYIEIGNDNERVQEAIKQLRPHVDVLIVTIHWGPNWQLRPSQEFVDFAHQVIDAGADILHGHSAHHIQGIEWYKSGLILYQTGDFVDDYAIDPVMRNDLSFLFVVDIEDQHIKSLILIPTRIDTMKVNKAAGKDYDLAVNRISRLSKELATS